MSFLRHLSLLLFILIAYSQINGCPQLCANNCYVGSCQSCYLDFTSTASTSSTSCTCPAGMFSNPYVGLCEPCPVQCQTCTNASKCLTCISGYMLSNSYTCIVNTTTQNNWVSKRVVSNYTNFMGVGPLSIVTANQTLINITNSNFQAYQTTCLGLDSITWFGGYQMFDYTTKVVKTLYNLPPHQWINVRLQAIMIDKWTGNTLVIELNQNLNYQSSIVTSPKQIWNGSFDSTKRFSDFCGDPTYFDNIAVVDAWAAHNSSLAKIQIRMNESEMGYTVGSNPDIFLAYWAMSDALVRVGTCGRNCQFCSSPSQCTYCHPPYYAVNGSCVCDVAYGLGFPTRTGCAPNCVEGEYYNSTAQSCIDCFNEYPNCRSCNSTAYTSCQMGFFYHPDSNGNNVCRKKCPSGFGEVRNATYIDADNSTFYRDECQPCPMNCTTCIHNICLFCESGFSYFQGDCIATCPPAHYSKNGVCMPCATGCLNCSSSACTFCPVGLQINSTGQCSSPCQSNNTCSTSCSTPCDTCFGNSTNECLSCISGYSLSGNQCFNNCPLRQYLNGGICENCTYGCKNCTNSTFCTVCIPGFFLMQTEGKCVRLCPSGFYPGQVDVNGVIENECFPCQAGCLRCINPTFCLDCQSNYTLFNFTCSTTVQNYYEWTNGSFRKCSPNCIKCRHQICTRCAAPWVLNQGECFLSCPAEKIVKTITNYNNGVYGGSYDVCVWKDPLCEVFATDGSGDCTQCSFTYPAGVLLESVSANSQHQDICSPYCPEFYAKNQDLTCTLCPDNCRRCKPDQTCLNCLDNYVINHPNLIVNIKNQTCVKNYCQAGYFSDSLQCQRCSLGCSQCLLDGRCHLCVSGYTMDPQTKICYKSICLLNQYYDIQNSICGTCSAPCLTCVQFATYCSSCAPIENNTGTYVNYVYQGTCLLACPIGTFAHADSKTCRACDPRCTTCSSIRNCTACANNFYLLAFYDSAHTPCVPQCPIGFWVNDTICQRCSPDCKSCYGPSQYQCLTCYPNFYLDEGKCVYFCSAMKYQDKKSQHCQWCHPSCSECWGQTRYQCITCQADHYFYNHQCFSSSCPGATYLSIPAQRLCEPCQFGCQYCSSSQFCYFCTPGYHYYQGWCYLNCPDNMQPIYSRYYMQLLGTVCQACAKEYSSNCVACDQGACLKCKEGMYLWQDSQLTVTASDAVSTYSVIEQCFTSCPNGTFIRDHECANCSAHCNQCSSYSSCTQCDSTYNLINGYCTQNCPQGYYATSAGCSTCDASCATCSSLSNCTTCPSTKYLKFNPTTQITSCVSACSSGYFADVSGWCVKCPSTCTECLNLTHCTSCYNGYALTSNRCTNSSTTNCITNCGQCSGGVCYQCHSPYLLLTNSSTGVQSCVTGCPDGFYAGAFQCKKCNASCATCNNSANNCTSCVAAMFLHKSSCVSACPVGFFANMTSKRCEECPQNCLNCNSNTCISCQNGFFLYGKECVNNCPSGTFASSTARMCFSCSGNCSICTDSQNCTSCISGYIFFNHSCYTQCPQHTYLTINQNGHQVCKNCKAPCYRCLDSQNCLSCVGGYLLNGTVCQQQCGQGYYEYTERVEYTNEVSNQNFSFYSQCQPCDDSCLTCSNSSTNCLSCSEDDESLLYSGQCIDHCPDGTFNSSNICLNCPPLCVKCVDQTSCEVCLSGAVLFNGRCLAACPQGYFARAVSNGNLQYNCTPCAVTCQTCNGDSLYDCTSCSEGYYYFNGMCLASCPQGYYPRNATGSCAPCPSTCIDCTSFANCSNCQTGYTLSNTFRCTNNNSNCSVANCLNCYAVTTGGTSMCQQCLPGYSLTANGTCVTTCPLGQYSQNGYCKPCGTNCTNCTILGCTKCISNNYLYNGNCYFKCPNGTLASTSTCQSDPCLYYNSTNSSACLACSSPYLFYNYSCVMNCPVTTVQSGSRCVPCPFNCRYCVSQSGCTECQTGTYLYQGQCRYQCPIGTFPTAGKCQYCAIPYCLQCSSANNCSACDQSAGAALSNNSCYLTCPLGTYRDVLLAQCINCSVGCSACVNSSQCTICTNNYYLVNGQCVMNCPVGTFMNSGVCTSCSTGCYSCVNATRCTLCQNGFNIYSSSSGTYCVTTCPTGFYAATIVSQLYNNSNAGICLPCSAPCRTCSGSGTTCTSCQSGYSLSGTTCTTSCDAGWYPIIQIGFGAFGYTFEIIVCFPCSPICATCSSWSTCTSCHSNMNLDPYGNCLSSCAPKQYYDSLTRLCINCSTQCYSCSGPLSTDCLSCQPPLQLYQGSCITNCPFGYYSTSTYYCQPCSSNCADCSVTSTNCTVCNEGALLISGSCSVSCGSGKYLDTATQICFDCHASCLNCSGPTPSQCTACDSTTFLYQGTCISTCPSGSAQVTSLTTSTVTCQTCPSNCQQCTYDTSSGFNCSSCSANYYLINGQCLTSCPVGTYSSPETIACLDCGINNCQTCIFNSSFQVQCTSCQSGYLMLTDQKICVSSCPTGYTRSGLNCVPNPICYGYMYNGFCLSSCPTAMYPSASTCLNCSQSCLACTSATSCLRCSNISYLFSNTTNNSVYCLSYCPTSYYASQGKCLPCQSNCLNCYVSQNQLKCSQCVSGMYLLNGQCLTQCPQGYYSVTQGSVYTCQQCQPNCAQCSVIASNCTLCQNANYSTPGCSSQICTSSQYELTNGSCANCHANCASCFGGAFYECNNCSNGLFFMNGQCLSACPSGYFASSGTCVLCPNYCTTCTSSTSCTQCDSNYYLNPATNLCVADCTILSTAAMSYYLNVDSCSPCSNIDINCIVCSYDTSSSTTPTCTQCSNSTYLYMGACYSTCPNNTYATTNNINICVNCSSNCLTCDSTGCLSCQSGQVLSNQQCISTCPSGSYMTTVNSVSTCQSCSSNCASCDAVGQCTSCTQPYALSNGTCSQCIDGYYLSGSTCQPCSSMCATCIAASYNCTSCLSDWVLFFTFKCVPSCPSGYYANANSVCIACSVTNCASCPDDVCQSCQSGYVRLVSSNVITCPSSCGSGYFLDVTTNNCQSCSSGCLTCSSAILCTQCNNTAYLYMDYCLSSCPGGFVPNNGSCTACGTNCFTCSSPTSCTLCNPGMTNNGDGTCSPTTNNCSTGYYYNSATSNCSQCYPTCLTCSGPSVSNCLTCFSGYTFSNGVCTADCNTGYFYNSISGNCELCSGAYNNCVSCNSTACTQCSTNYSLVNGSCTMACPSGTYLASGQCLSCSAYCLTCTSSTHCTQCINSSIILYNSSCHTSCPTQTYNNGTTCLPCTQTCLTCTNSATNCSSCVTPYSLYGSSCVASCPNGTYSSNYICTNCSTNCLLCTSATSCTSCANGFYELNGTCRSSCPTGYYTDSASNRCLACVSPCTQCVSRTNCSACQTSYTYNSTANTCQSQCGVGQYYNNSLTSCQPCSLSGCGVCNSTTCLSCISTKYAYYSNGVITLCLDTCGTGTYPDNTSMTCQPCYANCAACLNASYCTQCSSSYYLFSFSSNNINECVLTCPIGYFAFTDANGLLPPACLACTTNCNQCLNATYCQVCASNYYLFTTQNVNTATNVSCVNNCPSGYANPTVISGTGMCTLCGDNCQVCVDSATCTECVSTNYVVLNGVCTPYNCLNCLNCSTTLNVCYECDSNYYLYNGGCTSHCPNGYYANTTTGTCQLCMTNCLLCINSTGCVQCIVDYTFYDVTGSCENQGYILYGAVGNMSGFTSNVTQIMATTYVATSAGPIAFGALTNTYGVMQVCQCMYLMAGSSDNNPEMVAFLDSLSICSYTNSGNTTANTTSTSRLLTGVAYTDSFLTTAFPIFLMMAGFICAYIVVILFGKYNQSCCSSSPCLQKYMRYTCRFMEKRFKYIYVDLVMWISYLPFLYFAILQIKGVRWSTGIDVFSSLLAYVIIFVYPLYPIFILRKLFDKSDDRRENLQNYKAITLKLPIDEEEMAKQPLCASFQCCPREDPNTSMIEMSLSPFIDKVVRPVYNIDVPEYSQFRYFTIPHWRLAYAAIKYFRKLLFVIFVAAMPTPALQLSCLVGLSVVYMLYLFILRPKEKLYLILEIILEFLILGFEIFMLIYVTTSGASVSALSIVAHALGFALANSTLAIAIILNIMAYYTIFCCIVDCIRHLKASADEDEFRQAKEQIGADDQKDDLGFDDGEYDFPDEGINVDLEKDLIRQFDGDDDPEGLVANLDMEKELVRDFGRNVDDYPDTVIPVDLQKKLIHEFGGDRFAKDLVKNMDLEKQLVRNFGRTRDGDEYPETVIPYDLEKKLVRDFDGDRHPEDLVKNNDLQKQLVRNFGRNHDDLDDMQPPCIPYDLEKQLVRDFGGDAHPEDLVKNNDLEKDLVRNFGRPHDYLDDEPPCIPYDLEKKLVRDFGGENHPEDLVENRDMEKELVRNFGQNDGYVLPEDMPFAHQDLEKNLLKAYDGQDKELNLRRGDQPRRRGDDELTEENNLDDIPLDHLDLDQKEFQFNLGGSTNGKKQSIPGNDYSEMPSLGKSKKQSKKDKKGYLHELAENTQEQMAKSGVSDDSPQAEGLLKNKKVDKYRREVGTNKVQVGKGALREPTDNFKRPQKQQHSVGEQQSMEALFFSPNREEFVEEVDTGTRIKQKIDSPAKKPEPVQDKLRQTDGFGQFEEIVEDRKPAQRRLKPSQSQKAKSGKNILYGDDSFGEFGTGPAAQERKAKIKAAENKFYKGSDQEDQEDAYHRDKTNKYRRGNQGQQAKKAEKKFAEDGSPQPQLRKQGQYEHLFEGESNASIVMGEVRPPNKQKQEETYEDVVNKNKQQVFKQDPSKKALINLDSGQFEEVEYEDKPRGERSNSKSKDSGLLSSRRESEFEDSKVMRRRRNSSSLKLNKKTGGILGKEEFEVEDESGVSRDSRRSKIVGKKIKSGTLNIDNKSGDEQDLDEIHF